MYSVPWLGGYNYITPRRAGLSATAGLCCYIYTGVCKGHQTTVTIRKSRTWIFRAFDTTSAPSEMRPTLLY